MKTFLSIGSGPGIGMATAERFAREGFRVVLTSRDPAGLTERARGLVAEGFMVETLTVDAGDPAAVGALVREVEARFGTVDALHLNAASMRAATLETQPPETFVPDLAANIGTALVAVQAASAAMLARGDGTILLTGGAFAVDPNPDYLSLSIGKAGLRALTHALFAPFRDRGVHIASVNVATMVSAGSQEARGVADAFWSLHAARPEAWTAEVTYAG